MCKALSSNSCLSKRPMHPKERPGRSLPATRLWDHSPVVAGLSLRVTGLRQEEDVPLKDTLLMAAAPRFRFFPWGEEHFPVTVVLARPYVLGRLTLESPVTKLDVRPSLTVGLALNCISLDYTPPISP